MLKWGNAWDSPGSGLRQASHREMDEDVCSVSRTPSSPGFFFFFFNHIGTWLYKRRKQGVETLSLTMASIPPPPPAKTSVTGFSVSCLGPLRSLLQAPSSPGALWKVHPCPNWERGPQGRPHRRGSGVSLCTPPQPSAHAILPSVFVPAT